MGRRGLCSPLLIQMFRNTKCIRVERYVQRWFVVRDVSNGGTERPGTARSARSGRHALRRLAAKRQRVRPFTTHKPSPGTQSRRSGRVRVDRGRGGSVVRRLRVGNVRPRVAERRGRRGSARLGRHLVDRVHHGDHRLELVKVRHAHIFNENANDCRDNSREERIHSISRRLNERESKTFNYGYEDFQFSLAAHFTTILNPITILYRAVSSWVELKALNYRCSSHVHSMRLQWALMVEFVIWNSSKASLNLGFVLSHALELQLRSDLLEQLLIRNRWTLLFFERGSQRLSFCHEDKRVICWTFRHVRIHSLIETDAGLCMLRLRKKVIDGARSTTLTLTSQTRLPYVPIKRDRADGSTHLTSMTPTHSSLVKHEMFLTVTDTFDHSRRKKKPVPARDHLVRSRYVTRKKKKKRKMNQHEVVRSHFVNRWFLFTNFLLLSRCRLKFLCLSRNGNSSCKSLDQLVISPWTASCIMVPEARQKKGVTAPRKWYDSNHNERNSLRTMRP